MTDNELIKSATVAINQTWHFVPRTMVELIHKTTNSFWLKLRNPAVLSSSMVKDLRERLQKIGVKLIGWDVTTNEANFFLEVVP